jgi:hypothetical protein
MLAVSVQNGRPLQASISQRGSNGATNGAGAATSTNGAHVAPPATVPNHQVVQVAARASVDPKTVRRYLEGGRCHATTARRIAMGLVKCGLGTFVRS